MRVVWSLTHAIPRKDEIDGSIADAVKSLARRPIEDQHDFWKTLLSQPNMLRQLRGINFRGRGGDPKANPFVEAVNRAVVLGFFRFVREFWRGGTRRLTSPLITHDALSWLAKTQREDGDWFVGTADIRKGGAKKSTDPIFTYWGTAWAAIGIMKTLPK